MPPRYIVIANPGTKRCETYCRELRTYWSSRGEPVAIELVPWVEVALRKGKLDGLATFDRPAIVRLESPGKNERVLRLLLEAGADNDWREPVCDWQSRLIPPGLLLRPGLFYKGFCRVLGELRQAFDARPHLFLTACPLAIAEMFDKTATTIKLHAAGVPVPGWWQDLSPRGDEFYHWVRNCGGRTVYLKLNTGSSATGIVALYQEDHSFRGVSTLAEIEGQFFNSRLLSHLAGPGLDRAVNFLLAEGAFAQNGIPMAQIDGQNFDVRVVCVYGQPVAMIFRLSSEPMTNLHLGGRRGDDTRCRATIPKRIWLDALDHCSQAAQSFDATIAGVDLLFERGSYQHYVLEVNAFGDFFPGWHDSRGRSIHQLEIDATAQRYGA